MCRGWTFRWCVIHFSAASFFALFCIFDSLSCLRRWMQHCKKFPLRPADGRCHYIRPLMTAVALTAHNETTVLLQQKMASGPLQQCLKLSLQPAAEFYYCMPCCSCLPRNFRFEPRDSLLLRAELFVAWVQLLSCVLSVSVQPQRWAAPFLSASRRTPVFQRSN